MILKLELYWHKSAMDMAACKHRCKLSDWAKVGELADSLVLHSSWKNEKIDSKRFNIEPVAVISFDRWYIRLKILYTKYGRWYCQPRLGFDIYDEIELVNLSIFPNAKIFDITNIQDLIEFLNILQNATFDELVDYEIEALSKKL